MIIKAIEMTNELKTYIMKEPEYNVYIISDIEAYGLNSYNMELFAGYQNNIICFVIMRFYESFVIYSHDNSKVNLDEVCKFFLSYKEIRSITGKADLIKTISQLLPNSRIITNEYAILRKEQLILYPDNKEFLYSSCTSEKVYDTYNEISEYIEKYKDRYSSIKRIENICVNGRYRILKSSKTNKSVSIAGSAAESQNYAMISEVGTLNEYRNRGFSKIVVSNLCLELFGEGKKILTIFYNNKIAQKVYKNIGFIPIGEYSMLYV